MIILFVTLLNVTNAQIIDREQVREDLLFLKEKMIQYQPGLTTYNPNFEKEADSLIKRIPDHSTQFDFYSQVSGIASLANEGHYGVGTWSDYIHSGFYENKYKYLPLSVKILDGRSFIRLCYLDSVDIKPGDELIKINNFKTKDILLYMKDHIPKDGQIDLSAEEKLSSSFIWMYYLLIMRPEEFKLQLMEKNGKIKSVNIPALSREQIVTNYESMKGGEQKEPPTRNVYTLLDSGSTSVLSLYSFNYQMIQEQNLKAKKLYKTIFKDLNDRNVKNLIVDLRNNSGGRTEFAYELLPYIINRDYQENFKKTVSWEGKVKEYKIPKRSRHAFNGKFYVLVNSKTYSSAASLARYFKEYSDAVIIGSETASRYEGFAAGSAQVIFLLNTNFQVAIPRYLTIFPESRKQNLKDRGLIPDIQINYTIDDVLKERDLEMQKAFEMIER